MSVHKDNIQQERANTLKALRTLIRLKHGIAADNELNEILPKAEAYFQKRVNGGQLPSIAEVRKAVGA